MAHNKKSIPMENENKDGAVSPEELKAEQDTIAAAGQKAEEIKTKLVEDFGLDPVQDADKLDKLVEREMKHRKDLSDAIGQKIKHRTEKEELRKKVPVEAKPPTDAPKPVTADDISKGVAAELEKRDLDALDYPEDLKAEIRKVASTKGISIKKALTDSYVAYKIGEHQKTVDADQGATGRTTKTGASGKFDINKPPEADMSTEAGRKKWDEWIAEGKRLGF